MPRGTHIHQVHNDEQAKKDLVKQGVENEPLQLSQHVSLLHQASGELEASGGCCGCCFFRLRALTFGSLAGLALRFLSAVQYLRASSEEVSTECLMILAGGSDFERRFHAARYTPTSKHKRIEPTRGR